MNLAFKIEELDWQKTKELIPVIVQDNLSREVLMLGFMNEAALKTSLSTGHVTFYSRTKARLWMKGETSGNTLKIENVYTDCDKDTLLFLVTPSGPSCHRNTPSCFDVNTQHDNDFIPILESIIQSRRHDEDKNSYVKSLIDQGITRIAQKVGEEGVEVAIACALKDKASILNEASDLIFHLLVLLNQSDLCFADIKQELKRRHVPAF